MTIEKRLTRLEQLVASLIKRIDNEKFYTDSYAKCTVLSSDKANQKASGNEEGLLDIADVSSENSDCIVELAEMISNLDERTSALKGGN